MERAELLRRLDLLLTELDYTDRFASIEAGCGDQFIRNLRKSRTGRIDIEKLQRLAEFLRVPLAYFTDPAAAANSMGDELNEEWHRWATFAAEQQLGPKQFPERARLLSDLTAAFYRAIASRFRAGDTLSEAQALDLARTIGRRMAAQKLEIKAAIRTRKRQSRRPKR